MAIRSSDKMEKAEYHCEKMNQWNGAMWASLILVWVFAIAAPLLLIIFPVCIWCVTAFMQEFHGKKLRSNLK